MPHNHGHKLATVHLCGENEVKMAVEAALEAQREWAALPWEERVAVFLKAADLVSGSWRDTMDPATMLGRSKTPHQAEIEAAGELADFLRFGAWYVSNVMADEAHWADGVWNRVRDAPLVCVLLAVSAFNFTAIGGNLPRAPATCGNGALWKPSTEAVYSNYFIMTLLKDAGLPDGVINFLPGRG